MGNMKTSNRTSRTLRNLRDLALLWLCAAAAATVWAAGIADESDNWYSLFLHDRSVEVRKVTPTVPAPIAQGDDVQRSYQVRLPSARMKEGHRATYRYLRLIERPTIGKQYELMLRKTRFSFIVESNAAGTQVRVGYGGEVYVYPLGLPASQTVVHAVADLDGDADPDFIVEVGDEIYLLLSTRATPGINMPSAQLVSLDECGS